MSPKTKWFFSRSKAESYAHLVEPSHDVDVRQTSPNRFVVLIDSDTYWPPSGSFRLYSNLGDFHE
jgi:hypothetical protein